MFPKSTEALLGRGSMNGGEMGCTGLARASSDNYLVGCGRWRGFLLLPGGTIATAVLVRSPAYQRWAHRGHESVSKCQER